MKAATAAEVAPPPDTAVAIRTAIKSVLDFYNATATQETTTDRAVLFVAALSGAVGFHDPELGSALLAIVTPRVSPQSELEAA